MNYYAVCYMIIQFDGKYMLWSSWPQGGLFISKIILHVINELEAREPHIHLSWTDRRNGAVG